MNFAQLQGVIRSVLLFAGGSLVTKGVVSTDQLSSAVNTVVEVGGGIMSLGALGWSLYSNHASQLASQLAKSKQPIIGS